MLKIWFRILLNAYKSETKLSASRQTITNEQAMQRTEWKEQHRDVHVAGAMFGIQEDARVGNLGAGSAAIQKHNNRCVLRMIQQESKHPIHAYEGARRANVCESWGSRTALSARNTCVQPNLTNTNNSHRMKLTRIRSQQVLIVGCNPVPRKVHDYGTSTTKSPTKMVELADEAATGQDGPTFA
jgi:hypothetical protein